MPAAWTRRLALAIALLALAHVGAWAQAGAATGFDHTRHDGKVTITGAPSIACASCHVPGPRGAIGVRPGHAACFGACHGAPPVRGQPVDAARAPVCLTCHAPASLTAPRPTVAYPPYRLDPDYGLTFTHARHAAGDCTTCHAQPGGTKPRPAPHARCLTCHATTAPQMSDCAGCHPAGTGANLSPHAVSSDLPVGDAFDHARHRRRSPGAPALACATCHVATARAAGLELPTPTVASCSLGGCHDGAAAFATTERCTRCHIRAPAGSFVVARPTARFSHSDHAGPTLGAACAGCHPLAADGQIRTAGHAACTGAACHAADFAARQPTICGACHVATEPWRALTPDRSPPSTSEFGVEISHQGHAAIACARCHRHDTATTELRPERGHGACIGAGCHEAAGGPAPTMTACAACHGLGQEAARRRQRTEAPWTVRARFRHGPHDPAAVACADCHVDVAAATTVAAIAGPPKAACAGCHDGARAFRMTGHGCARCHGR